MAYLHNNKDQFQDAIELAYEQTGIMAQAIEKDYYVTMLLRLLSEKMPYIVFKGGTSLSKCHKVIKRFSEDIDITIDTQISQGKKKKIKHRKNVPKIGTFFIFQIVLDCTPTG